jgi:hypothetical protein
MSDLMISAEDAACSALVSTLERESTAAEGLACRTWVLERAIAGDPAIAVHEALASVDDALLNLRHSELARAVVTTGLAETVGLSGEPRLSAVLDAVDMPWTCLLETQRRTICATIAELGIAVSELRQRLADRARHDDAVSDRVRGTLERLVPLSLQTFLAA